MEKLQTIKKNNNAVIPTKIKHNNFDKQSDLKEKYTSKTTKSKKQKVSFKYFKFYEHHKIFFDILKNFKIQTTILFVCTIVLCILCIIAFSNNPYYLFLNRPKILKNSSLLIIMMILFLVLLFSSFISNLSDIAKIKKLSDRQNISIIKNIELNNKKEVIKSYDKKNLNNKNELTFIKQKKAAQKNNIEKCIKNENVLKINEKYKKSINFKQYILIFSLFLSIILFFSWHVLWFCVFICFAIFFALFTLLYKSNGKKSRIFCLVLLLNFVCILLSFYFIYLLN